MLWTCTKDFYEPEMNLQTPVLRDDEREFAPEEKPEDVPKVTLTISV